MKTKTAIKIHTPAPWKWLREEAMIESEMPDLRGDYTHICDFRTHALSGEYNEADARLIACAPELLSALKLALDYLSPKHNNGHTRAWTQGMILACQMAVDKAEGKDEA